MRNYHLYAQTLNNTTPQPQPPAHFLTMGPTFSERIDSIIEIMDPADLTPILTGADARNIAVKVTKENPTISDKELFGIIIDSLQNRWVFMHASLKMAFEKLNIEPLDSDYANERLPVGPDIKEDDIVNRIILIEAAFESIENRLYGFRIEEFLTELEVINYHDNLQDIPIC